MDETKQPKAAVWAVTVAIITSILTYWQYEAKLVSPRPVFQGIQESSTIGDQKFPARLWQDPLLDYGTNVIEGISSLATQISLKRQKATNDGQVEVMGVMMEGFPYPEDVEARLRIRYAVETALFAQGYKSSDRRHLFRGTMPGSCAIRLSPTQAGPLAAFFRAGRRDAVDLQTSRPSRRSSKRPGM